jgi:hypothetical protein
MTIARGNLISAQGWKDINWFIQVLDPMNVILINAIKNSIKNQI